MLAEDGAIAPLPLLGDRHYIHGSTLLDAVRLMVGPIREFKVALHGMLRSQPCLKEFPSVAAARADPATRAVFSGRIDGRTFVVGASESGNLPIYRRHFDETACRSGARIDGLTILQSSHGVREYSDAERVVALNKALLASAGMPAGMRFVRLALTTYPALGAVVSLSTRRVDPRLTRSVISTDDDEIGWIDFVGPKVQA